MISSNFLVREDLIYLKSGKNKIKNPIGALEISANVATAAASRNPKNVLSTLPELINFFHKGRGLH